MIITIVTIIINVLILLIATVFETIQYFSWNKKQLLLRKIHGYSLFSSNVRYLTISILLSIMLAYTTHILFGSKILLFIIMLLLLFNIYFKLLILNILKNTLKI
ncbi:DUF1430 domain-containing protein [Staphylococcus aureus]